jgi:hypothetical protein
MNEINYAELAESLGWSVEAKGVNDLGTPFTDIGNGDCVIRIHNLRSAVTALVSAGGDPAADTTDAEVLVGWIKDHAAGGVPVQLLIPGMVAHFAIVKWSKKASATARAAGRLRFQLKELGVPETEMLDEVLRAIKDLEAVKAELEKGRDR